MIQSNVLPPEVTNRTPLQHPPLWGVAAAGVIVSTMKNGVKEQWGLSEVGQDQARAAGYAAAAHLLPHDTPRSRLQTPFGVTAGACRPSNQG